MVIAYRLYLAMLVIVASGELFFEEIKVNQDVLTNYHGSISAILSIENKITNNLDFEDFI